MSEPAPAGDAGTIPPASPAAPAPPVAPDPEDWQSTAASGDDERYLRERPPHWE